MSLDGFVAGLNNDDSGLHDWYFAPCGSAVGVIDELLNTIGAMIIGRRSVADGIKSALAQAQAAGEKAVCVAGGAATAQQFLQAGLLDEVQIHLVSNLLGDGLRLFEHGTPVSLERTRVLRREIAQHREWMIRAFAIGLAVATIRPIIGLFFATSRLSGLTPDAFFGIAFWIGFVLPFLAAESSIRWSRPLRRSAARPTAAGLE